MTIKGSLTNGIAYAGSICKGKSCKLQSKYITGSKSLK